MCCLGERARGSGFGCLGAKVLDFPKPQTLNRNQVCESLQPRRPTCSWERSPWAKAWDLLIETYEPKHGSTLHRVSTS